MVAVSGVVNAKTQMDFTDIADVASFWILLSTLVLNLFFSLILLYHFVISEYFGFWVLGLDIFILFYFIFCLLIVIIYSQTL